ncbi:MAG TPA: glycosyltransferase family 4 protein [Desulfobacteria bacterium]|nr:glycosyltransferase family 4 protein [Desulfobacteria bacterium]
MKSHLLELLHGLTKQGFTVETACPDNSTLINEIAEMGIKTYPIHIVGPVSPRDDILCISQLRKIILTGAYNIVHLHGSKAGMVGRIAALSAGYRNTVMTVHNFIIYQEVNPAKKLMFKYGEKILSSATSKIITVSAALKNDLVRNFGIPEKKIVPIYNGIDLKKYLTPVDGRKAREKYGFSPDTLTVGTLARMAPQKGLEYFIRAIPLIEQNDDTRYIVAGDGPLLPSLKALAGELGLGEKLSFTGFVENVPEFLSCLDIFVVPSIAEGLSITTIEAMSAGLPVVASRTGGLPELVKHGETGLLVEPRDPVKLAQAVTDLLSNRDKRQVMGSRANKKASAMFNLEKMVGETCRIYDEIIKDSACL